MEDLGSVNKGKKAYGKPMLISEEFVPNLYVAACAYRVTVECNYADDNGGGHHINQNGGSRYHSACGIAVPINISDGGTGIEQTVTVGNTTYGGHAIYGMVVGGEVNCNSESTTGATGSTNLENLTVGKCYNATWNSRGSDTPGTDNYNTIYTHHGVATVTAIGNFS